MTGWGQLDQAANLAVCLAYFGIFALIFVPLVRLRQLRTNKMATATALIFLSCAIGHGMHAASPTPASVGGLPHGQHAAISWWAAVWDSITACVAIYYLSLRHLYGRLLGTVPMFDDLAEQERVAELELFRAESAARAEAEAERDFYAAMMKSINQNSHSLIHVKDLHGRYLMVNASFERAFGITEAELVGQDDTMLDPELAPLWRANDLLARQGVQRLEEYANAPDGRHIFDSAKFPVFDQNGALSGTCGISLDVPEVKRASAELAEARDAALAATAAKSTFLATMSHEIRTPMNAVIGMTDLLLGTELDSQQQECLQTVRSSGDALLAVINDILDFSKIESGELVIAQQPFDVRAEVDSCLDLVMATAVAKGLDVACHLEPSCPSSAIGDASRIRQILINLLANAVKFTERGDVLVTVSASPLSDDRTRLTVVVTDTGIGISPTGVRGLFKSFSQVDASASRAYGGTGLGLVISQRLARAMGGDVTVASELGVGSTFTVTVELGSSPDAADEQTPQAKRTFAGLTALVVDDSPATRHVVERQLVVLGVVCTSAAGFQEAQDLLDEGLRYDVVLVDAHLPQDESARLVAALRSDQGSQPRPVILLSNRGVAPPGARGDGIVVLPKPIRGKAVHEAVAQAMSSRVPAAAPQEQTAQLPAAQPLHILLAEDNVVNQRVAQLMLGRLGHVVDTVDNGRAAVEAVARSVYDVVLMDVQMPGMDGLEATRRIRASLSAEEQPHIIAMTANALVEDRDACVAAGMESYLTKPVRVDELKAMLLRVGATIRQRPAIRRDLVVEPSTRTRTAAPTPPEPTVLDQTLTPAPTDGLLTDLIARHISDTTATVPELAAAVRSGDATKVRSVTSTWHLTSELLGASALATLLRQAHDLARSEPQVTPVLAAQIESEYASVSASVHRLQLGFPVVEPGA